MTNNGFWERSDSCSGRHEERHEEFQAIDSRNDFAMALVQRILLHLSRQTRTDFEQLLVMVMKNEDLMESGVAKPEGPDGPGYRGIGLADIAAWSLIWRQFTKKPRKNNFYLKKSPAWAEEKVNPGN